MTIREEMLKLAEERGFSVVMRSGDETWYNLSHNTYTFGLELWPDEKEFRLVYVSGLFTFSSGKCGSFDNDIHFDRFFKQMKTYCLYISEAKDVIVARNERINKLKANRD